MPAPRVIYLAAGYSRAGGVEVYILHYATEMRRRGYDPSVLVFEPLPQTPHWCLLALGARGIPIRSLGDAVARRARWRARGSRVLGRVTGRRRLWHDILNWETKRTAVAQLRQWIRHEQPAIIHVQGRLVAEAWSVLPPERTIFHIATAGQRDESWEPAEVTAFHAFVENCARVFAPGRRVAERFRHDFGVARPVDVIFTMAPDLGTEDGGQRAEGGNRRTAEPQNIEPSHAPRTFGFLGRLHEEKGLNELLDALALLKNGINIPFLFAGEGPMAEVIRARIEHGDIGPARIEPVKDPSASLTQMDVMVLPSRSEAMPLALVEAMMCGRPCIATAVGGIPDLIRDGVEGFLLPDNRPATVAAAIRRMCALPPDAFAAMARAARARYEACCRPEAVGAVVEKHYRSVIGG